MAGRLKYVDDGDLGSGEPGSLQWHKCNLLQCEDQAAYITEAFPNMDDGDKLAVTLFLIEVSNGNSNGRS